MKTATTTLGIVNSATLSLFQSELNTGTEKMNQGLMYLDKVDLYEFVGKVMK